MSDSALVIFDIDGTLLQAHLITVPAVQRTFADYGLPIPDAEGIVSFFGRPVEEYHAWLAERCPPDLSDEVIQATDKRELELIGTEGELYPGVVDALTRLRYQGHVTASCSNGPEDYVDEALDAHGLRPLFDVSLCRGMGYESKGEMVRRIMAQYGLSDGEPGFGSRIAVVVGDRRDDVTAAHENGAFAIGAAYGFGSQEELAGADATVDEPCAIPDAVDALLERRGAP